MSHVVERLLATEFRASVQKFVESALIRCPILWGYRQVTCSDDK
jgi:hypothetical protein